jgi:quinol monooxygenase YgiN
MMTHTAVKTSEWVERARVLAPVVEQWRDASEQERHVPRPLFEALRDARRQHARARVGSPS